LARSKRRIGPSFHREGSKLLYSDVAGETDRCRHAVEQNLDVVRRFGLAVADRAVPGQIP